MLESLAAWVLKYYLGKYVENLNTDQLSIGLLQGQVELENLPLKKEALRQAGLPIQIKAGFIGKVKLQIPIRQIRTAPWVILIEKLYLVAGPVNLDEWDEVAEAQAMHEQKMSALDALEVQWRENLDSQDQGYYAASYSSWLNYGTSIITSIVENLQLNITDVHFRYEDEICIPDQTFTFGLAIESLVAQSCNEDWEPGFDSGPIGFKIVELSKFSIYWDDCSLSEMLGGKESSDFMECMGKVSCRGRQFVLNHVSGVAHIKRNRSSKPLRSRATPRIICDVLFNEFPIVISDKQYYQMILWLKGVAVINTRIRNHRFRPQCSVFDDPRAWWRYALQAVLHKIRPHRYSLEIFLKRIKDNVIYVGLFSKVLNSPNRTRVLTDEEQAEKTRIELDQNFEELRILREVAMRRASPPAAPPPPPPQASKIIVPSKKNFLSTWFPQWWYSNNLAQESTSLEERGTLEDEIFDVFATTSDTNYLKRDAVFGHFNFSLKQGSVRLATAIFEHKKWHYKSLMELQFEKVLVGCEYRPRSSSYKTTLALGSIYLKDRLTKDTVFPMLVSPQSREQFLCPETKRTLSQNLSRLLSHAMTAPDAQKHPDETLFQLTYEFRPVNSGADYRLLMKTQSLDIVYNPEAVNWLIDFFTKPLHQTSDTNLRVAARQKYQAIKAATKNELIKNWERILAGDLSNRKTWEIDLDISAPQIIFVEHFCDKNAVIVVVDFGHLHFTNCVNNPQAQLNKRESDDEEAFQTPCSTPPGSGASPTAYEPQGIKRSSLNELILHHKLYDRYELELGDMQVLVGKVKDNWKYAHLKGTSTLHVLDRFNISLQVERRIVHTTDPQFPSLTFFGNLPRLVVHVNEQKISALRAMLAMITDQGLPSPFRSSEPPIVDNENERKSETPQDENILDDHSNEMSKLIIMQFTVQHLALEVQSRNRSIAELQVSGVRAAATLRPFDTSVTLSVHSLLLVDALQTFGRDFELLVASHKHVVMDSLSGSIRDSEPTSPIPPGSPEPSDNLVSPIAFSQVVSSLQHKGTSSVASPPQFTPRVTSPMFTPYNTVPSPILRAVSPVIPDTEALICVELTFVSGSCPGHGGQPLQIAAIQFNNLDIIANQETIVELLGFARRVFPGSKSVPLRPSPVEKEMEKSKAESLSRQSLGDEIFLSEQIPAKTEVTFDFHRLNVLLLRAVHKDGALVGRKICTATMMQAKIKATVGEDLIVEGSLGGIQIVDLTPEGMKHQRILSLGADPLGNETLADLSAGLYSLSHFNNDKTAFSFSVKRSLQSDSQDGVDVKVRLASVWYTHSPLLVKELQSCATEFKQYLSNLARSIKSAATEMAMGFVHARAEALAQKLSMSGRLSASLYGGSTFEINSPKKRRRSFTQSVETLCNTSYTPYSPVDDDMLDSIEIRLDVVLDSPVIILPMSPTSDRVFVAHLGKITARNTHLERNDCWSSKVERYNIEIRDMNLYSVTATNNLSGVTINMTGDAILPRPERMYASCDGKPILHNTVIEIVTERQVTANMTRSWDFDLEPDWNGDQTQISGCVVGPLKVSLTREQYQQLLETIDNLFKKMPDSLEPEVAAQTTKLGDIQEEESDSMFGVSTLSLDPTLRARMLNSSAVGPSQKQLNAPAQALSLRVLFELPEFTIELLGELGCLVENSIVSISFRDFILTFDQANSLVSHLQMRLKSLVMEDLLVDENSKNRFLVVSSAAPEIRVPHTPFSQSCPNLANFQNIVISHNSLPDKLYEPMNYAATSGRQAVPQVKSKGIRSVDNQYPCTPPPSPRSRKSPVDSASKKENLVFINVTMVDREASGHLTQYEGMNRIVTVDFNCLDVIANIESWVVVFDFFGIDKTPTPDKVHVEETLETKTNSSTDEVVKPVNSKLDLEVRSLTLVLIRPEYEVAKANISHLSIKTKTCGPEFSWEGRLGSMSLADLSPHGKLYRERFLSSGNQALHVQYKSFGNKEETCAVRHCDSELRIEMSSIFYVHTGRFLGEIYAYFDRFSQFQALMVAMRSSDNENRKLKPSSRMLLEINAGSPVLLLPVSSTSPEVLVVNLGKLTVRNRFRRAGCDGTVTSNPPEGTTTVSCLLDVMSLDLVNMDLYAGIRHSSTSNKSENKTLEFGSVRITKQGPSLLPNECHLKLQIDRNLDTHLSREVPDISIKGTLEKLEASLDLSQYKLIRGLLSYNIGENLQDLSYVSQYEFFGNMLNKGNTNEPVWLMNSIHLDLVNVVVHLKQTHGEGIPLACINFIKSRLVVETFSDRSQDIDLVSAEILITDTRFTDEPLEKRCNVFTNILQPLSSKHSKEAKSPDKFDKPETERDKIDFDDGTVQAEVHHRRRKNYSKATVLLHNMRLMAVLDWWEIIRDFLVTNAPAPAEVAYVDHSTSYTSAYNPKPCGYVSGSSGVVTKCPTVMDCETIPYEFKLNITDSEIILVEDTSVLDSNAIILKSTTVISYRPELLEKPLSCNLNRCEVFSCILGMEDETALSIIDPVTVNMEVTLRTNLSEARGLSDAVYTSADRTLEIQMQHLCVRLSYHDFRMLSQMLNSVPKQTYKARTQAHEEENYPASVRSQIHRLSGLGFSAEDCTKALDICCGQLDDAALWLTQNAAHVPDEKGSLSDSKSTISFDTIEVKLSCLSICVIDDCRDADVPLLELSMSQLSLKQEIEGAGSAKFLFTSDYYNRVLSGWEPFIEPWRCSVRWEHSLTSSLLRNRLQIQVQSEELLNINVTSTLLKLYSMVKDNWTQDYCNPHRTNQGPEDSQKSGAVALRRRSPFVPFALKNDTGSILWFTVLVKTSENLSDAVVLEQDSTWMQVLPNETVPFTFGGRGKVRHRDTHTVRVHQLAVRVDMWKPAAPVSVDKVGVYFRQAAPNVDKLDLPPMRLVFAITLEGSARKLVTVRSGIIIKNMLSESVEVKLENTANYPDASDPTKCLNIESGKSVSAPISHSFANIWVRPLISQNLNRYHAFSNAPLNWTKVRTAGEVVHEVYQCHSNRDRSYRFVASIQRENFPEYVVSRWPQPGHTIVLISPLTMINLLPCDLHYSIKEANVRGHIKPGMSAAIHEVDCDCKFEIHFHIENFPKHGVLLVPSPVSSLTCRIKVHDESGRRLDLSAAVQINKGAEINVTVWAPYWIINKTSLPLVFKQEGTTNETAGQFIENEIARVVTPLLFSLSDPDASPTIQARVGALYHPDRNPQWCEHFHLQVGSQVRQLHVSQRDHRPDIVYAIGINIRPGRGRYRNTNIVTLSPRFQLHNKSSYQLQFAQKCLATTLNDPGAVATYATAVKDCSLAWHWPRLDKNLLLCIRLLEVENCLWSGGFGIDNEDSLHINIRDKHGKMHFLRVEVVLQAATYFVVFTDADTMPPPVRINNFSQVAIQFYQTGVHVESLQSTVRPQTSVDYAWDEPLGPSNLTLIAPGGASGSYDVNSTIEESAISLTYENFIYIAFTATFNRINGDCSDSSFNPLDIESQQLVLDCVDEYRVILNRKQPGARSQLWRMTSEGQLQHEGSSPPRDPRSKSSDYNDKILVLDIAGTAPQPMQCVALVLRRLDKRRASTQKWRFTQDGRLCCAHRNMCVQAKDGFFGLRQGNEAVLGPSQESPGNGYNSSVPMEQAVSRMKMRPGSGCLSVSITSDGPTRVLKIIDPIDARGNFQYNIVQERQWSSLISSGICTKGGAGDSSEFQLTIDLKAGFGVSIVSRKPPEELLFLHLKGILLDTVRTPSQKTFDCTIQDIQCDNQLFEPQCPVVLYVTRGLREDEPKKHLPAVQISAHKQTCNKSNAHIFKHLIITVKNLSLRIEERLMLKLYAMFGNHSSVETEDVEESDFETQRMVMEATSVHATRYYFGILKFEPSTVRLSVVTSAKLPPPLQALKRKLHLTLIKFEDATVELEPFIKKHPFETAQFLINSVLKHFKQELKWQAAIILGSVDFLGSPLGLMNDVTEGFSGLLNEGNVGALFKNVAHGLSNSTAKVTESLSDGLGRVILDDTHEQTRQRIRKLHSGSSSDHIVAGLKGLGLGIYGGVTSVFKQSYEGATTEGFQGFISGFGKGLVGTVTKPVVGILDLATETASAVRDSSRSTLRSAPPRVRLSRCVVGPGGLLPHYSAKQSQGQEFLYTINERNYSEVLLYYEILRSEYEDLRILISSDSIRVFTMTGLTVVLEVQLNNFYHSQPLSLDEKHTNQVLHYIELTMRADATGGQETIKRPRVRCDNQSTAISVSEKINYSKALFEERSQTVMSSEDVLDDD
ncbi:hypothetical protein RUM44_009125 [Polyplax serrata]|uniref:UBA domain-containing protein n=1 Tax=Polyplax serrata TaxID=468196 RepID=A0ABR1ART7_POLSC